MIGRDDRSWSSCSPLHPELDLDAWTADCARAAVLELRDQRWRFAHDKLRELLDALLSATARRELHPPRRRGDRACLPGPRRLCSRARCALARRRGAGARGRLCATGGRAGAPERCLRRGGALPATRARADAGERSRSACAYATAPPARVAGSERRRRPRRRRLCTRPGRERLVRGLLPPGRSQALPGARRARARVVRAARPQEPSVLGAGGARRSRRAKRAEGAAHALPGALSTTDRKRLEVARALASDTKLLLLDEVMAGIAARS